MMAEGHHQGVSMSGKPHNDAGGQSTNYIDKWSQEKKPQSSWNKSPETDFFLISNFKVMVYFAMTLLSITARGETLPNLTDKYTNTMVVNI